MTPDFTGRMLVPLRRLEERKDTVELLAWSKYVNVGVDCAQGGCNDGFHAFPRSGSVLREDLRRTVGSDQQGLVGNGLGAIHAG